MKIRRLLVVLAMGFPFLQAHAQQPQPQQETTFTLSDIVEGVQQWAQDNLDTNFLNSLPEVDEQKTQQFFHDLEQRFQGEYVVDLAPLKQVANALLPILESHEEAQPYVAWLKAQLDYLDVAEEYSLTNPPPKIEPGQPPKPVPNPPPQMAREIWIKKVALRPWPEAAKDFVPRLKPVFLAQKIPAELVWVAEVESAFDARAKSPAGAAGLFQLMPDTAKRFGLSLWPRDQRLQPEASASASAQYLKILHDRFKDWRLTLAAYNAGEGTVQKLLDRYKTTDYDRIATHLPAETQMYVPKVEATILRREGHNLGQSPLPQN